MSKIVSEQIKKVEILISGMKSNKDIIKKAGLDENLISELETENNALNADNFELERLKTEVREKSRATTKKMVNLRRRYVETKRSIKKNADSAKWGQFGIMDRR
jgi:hypothetical protein